MTVWILRGLFLWNLDQKWLYFHRFQFFYKLSNFLLSRWLWTRFKGSSSSLLFALVFRPPDSHLGCFTLVFYSSLIPTRTKHPFTTLDTLESPTTSPNHPTSYPWRGGGAEWMKVTNIICIGARLTCREIACFFAKAKKFPFLFSLSILGSFAKAFACCLTALFIPMIKWRFSELA